MSGPAGVGRAVRGAASLFALVAALVAGCAALPARPLPPQVTLEALRVDRVAAGEARFTLALAVANPNAYDLAVQSFDAQLSVEGEPLLSGSLTAPVVLAAQRTTPVEIAARARFDALAVVIDRVLRGAAPRYEIAGTAVVQDGLRLPFARRGVLGAEALPGLRR